MDSIDGITWALMVLIVSLSFWVYSERENTKRVRLQRNTARAELAAATLLFERELAAMKIRLETIGLDRDGWRDIARDAMWGLNIVQEANHRASRVIESVAAERPVALPEP